MVMLVDIAGCDIPFVSLVDELSDTGRVKGVQIYTMHEDIFNAMHKI